MRLKVQRVRSRSSSDSARSRHNRREQARTGGCIAQVRRDQSDTTRHSIVTKRRVFRFDRPHHLIHRGVRIQQQLDGCGYPERDTLCDITLRLWHGGLRLSGIASQAEQRVQCLAFVLNALDLFTEFHRREHRDSFGSRFTFEERVR